MIKIENEIEHDAICQRVEELLLLTDDDSPLTDPKLIELRILSELVIEYEEEHYSVRENDSYKTDRVYLMSKRK